MKGAIVLCLLMLTPTGECAYPDQVASDSTKTTENVTVAVSVARTTTESEGAFPLTFPDIVVDMGGAWDPVTSSLTVSQASTYFFHLNAGAASGQRINMDLRGTEGNCDIFRYSTAHNGTDTLGRSQITNVKAGAPVRVENIAGSVLYSQGNRHTSFTAFDLAGYMDPANQVIFSAARYQPFTDLGPVVFNNILVNIGGNFNPTTSSLEVFFSGTYVLMCSIGLPSGTAARAYIRRNGQEHLAELRRQSEQHNGPDTISTLIVVELSQNDVIDVDITSGTLYSDSDRQTSFGGFLYNPVSGMSNAWSVYSTTTVISINGTDPYPFDTIRYDGAGMYNTTAHAVNILTSGIYFVYLNMGANFPTGPVDAYVVRGRWRPEMNIYRSATNHVGVDTLSQGLLLKLSAGETLRVVLGPNSSVSNGLTGFSGFLLGPT